MILANVTLFAIQTACKKVGSDLWPKVGKQKGPEIDPGMKIGQNSPKIGNQRNILFWGAILAVLAFWDLFRDLFVSYFGPKARNLFSSRPSGSQCFMTMYIAIALFGFGGNASWVRGKTSPTTIIEEVGEVLRGLAGLPASRKETSDKRRVRPCFF